jgi:membrane fusion protein (multidrug efflux system)
VTKIYFQPGQTVAEGAALMDINPAILEGQLHSQQAQLSLNEANYRRAGQLYRKQLFAKAELDKQLALLNASKAEVASAQAKLAQAKIKAPFAGKVGLNKVNIGDYVPPGQDLVSLQAIDPMRIDFNVPEVYADRLAVGQIITMNVASVPGQLFRGQLSGIDSIIEPSTRSISVRAQIPNKEQKLLPGAFAEVTLYLGHNKPVLTVPQQAVVYDGGKTFLFKITASKANRVAVKIANRIGNDIVVEEGIVATDQIVTAGQLKLLDQAPVVVKK